VGLQKELLTGPLAQGSAPQWGVAGAQGPALRPGEFLHLRDRLCC